MYENLLRYQAEIDAKESCFSHVECYISPDGLACLHQCVFSQDRFDLTVASRLNICLPDSVLRSVNKRQVEFTAGRYMAQLGIEKISAMQWNVPIGLHREPLWPAKLKGSISHSCHQAIALVTKQSAYRFVGLDIENIVDLQVAEQICRSIYDQREIVIVTEQGLSVQIATSIIFSAKESLFKALFPYVGHYFGFECARVIEFNSAEHSLILEVDKGLSHYCSGQKVFKCRYFINVNNVTSIILQ